MGDPSAIVGNFTDARHDTYIYAGPMIIGLCLIATIINGIILYCYKSIGFSRLNPTLMLTLSLVVSDIWTSLWTAFHITWNSYLPYVHSIDLSEDSACFPLFLETIRLSGLETCVLHLFALSLNHYLSVIHAMKYRSIFTMRRVRACIAFMWLVPLVLMIAYACLVPGKGLQSPGGNCLDYTHYLSVPYRLVMSGLILLLLGAMCGLYAKVVLYMRRMQSMFTSGDQSERLRRQRTMTVTAVLICATCVTGWTPALVQYALSCAGCPLALDPQSDLADLMGVFVLSLVGICFVIAKSIVNPIVYAVRIPEIKEQMALLFPRLGLVPPPDRGRAACKYSASVRSVTEQTAQLRKTTATNANENAVNAADAAAERARAPPPPSQRHLVPVPDPVKEPVKVFYSVRDRPQQHAAQVQQQNGQSRRSDDRENGDDKSDAPLNHNENVIHADIGECTPLVVYNTQVTDL